MPTPVTRRSHSYRALAIPTYLKGGVQLLPIVSLISVAGGFAPVTNLYPVNGTLRYRPWSSAVR